MIRPRDFDGIFLDRDGVINRRIPGGYVQYWSDFSFLPGALSALASLAEHFTYLFVVTNQQGIGKGLMTEEDLQRVHQKMRRAIEQGGGRIDAIYFCGKLKTDPDNCRKPKPAMGLQAKAAFPQLRLERCLMVGDSHSDMVFGRGLGMTNVLIEGKEEEVQQLGTDSHLYDYRFDSLGHMCEALISRK